MALLLSALPVLADAADLEFGPPFTISDDLQVPTGLAVDPANDRLVIADTANHRIRHTTLGDFAGPFTWSEFGFVSDRSLPDALNEPQGVAVDGSGHVYVVDTLAGEVQLYRYDGTSDNYSYDSSFASTTRNSVDGTDIHLPRDIAVGPAGKIYLLDSGNGRVLVADGPDDDSWSVWRAESDWGNPYGLDVDVAGDVYIADTENSRVLRLPAGGGAVEEFGQFGTASGQFRFPRDIAVGSDRRIYVADTDNHRIVILQPDGSFYRNLGGAPLFGMLQKIVVDADDRVFVVDSNQNRVIAFPGPDYEPPFDAYVRDYVGDDGSQPSDSAYALSSPDILVRHNPDIDTEAAAAIGLESFAFQQPRFDRNNYVYVAVRNRGEQPITDVTARLYWTDPGSPLEFPADWSSDGFFTAYVSASSNTPGNSLHIPSIDARHMESSSEVDGITVVGPIIWRPPAPESTMAGDGRFYLSVRLLNLHDPSMPAPGLEKVRLNNNMALRTPEVSRGPFPVGDQDTLVVRADFSDISGSADETTVNTRITETGVWLDAASYGQVAVKPLFHGPVALDHPRSHYEDATRNLLIEMAEEVLDKLLAAEPGVLDGPTADADDDIDRIVIVVNDPAFDTDWATTGLWPYDAGGDTRYLSVSVQGPDNSTQQFAHGFSHQLRLEDLYVHEGVDVDATLPHTADGWDNMATPFDGAQPLAWSKEHATWVTSHGGKILFIPRPPSGTERSGEPPIHLVYQALLESDDIGAIAIGLTEGATTFESEHHFYWVEARSPDLSSEDTVPADGVLVYYANKLIPQGEAPVIVRDDTPSTSTIDDAVLEVGDNLAPAGTGIDVSVTEKLADDGGYMIDVEYDPPPEDYDVHIRTGDPHWTSPDIWVDNQRTGGGYESYNSTVQLSTGPVDDKPITDEENRVYARIHNTGPATAYDIEVRFEMSEPYHTVGGEGDFDERAIRIIDEIPAGEYRDVYFIWQPDGVEDPHNCVRVLIRRLVNDTDDSNNDAQQNLHVITSESASPYDLVQFGFQISHEEEMPQLFYFREDGTPSDWMKSFSEEKRLVNPGERFLGALDLKPPDDAPLCTDHEIRVTAWTPRGDTLIRVGGTTVDVGLRNRTEMTIEQSVHSCGKRYTPQVMSHNIEGTYTTGTTQRTDGQYSDVLAVLAAAGVLIDAAEPPTQCAVIRTAGCTNPPRPNERVTVRYKDPAGNPVYREVMTDEYGCFEDSYVVVEGGAWEATGHYAGDQCSGPATASVTLNVPLAETGDQDGDGLPDEDEVQGDADGDGIPNHLDRDSDNDGVIDGDEVYDPDAADDGSARPDPLDDADADGLDNVVDPDSDNDGIPDGEEPPGDPDGDGLDNRIDDDSDGDGISDGEDDTPYLPGGCNVSPETAWWAHLVTVIILLASLLLVVVAYVRKRPMLLAYAALLLLLLGVATLLICPSSHLAYGLAVLLLIILVLLMRRMSASTP